MCECVCLCVCLFVCCAECDAPDGSQPDLSGRDENQAAANLCHEVQRLFQVSCVHKVLVDSHVQWTWVWYTRSSDVQSRLVGGGGVDSHIQWAVVVVWTVTSSGRWYGQSRPVGGGVDSHVQWVVMWCARSSGVQSRPVGDGKLASLPACRQSNAF